MADRPWHAFKDADWNQQAGQEKLRALKRPEVQKSKQLGHKWCSSPCIGDKECVAK